MSIISMSNLFWLFEFDVFLCFHGKDTREGFTSFLCDVLHKNGIKAFMDVQLRKGQPLNKLIENITKSRISVVVFSENFASSEWCLNELAFILERREAFALEVLPIFYKVDPSELTDQLKGRTAEHLAEHAKTYREKDPEKVKQWRGAVKNLGTMNGLPYKHGVEPDFIQKIVRTIHEKLQWKN